MRHLFSALLALTAALLLAVGTGYAADDEPASGSEGGNAAAHNDEGDTGSDHGDPGEDGGDHGSDSAHGGGGHHNESDLTHANAGDELESPAEFQGDLAIWTAVVFVVLLIVLTKFAWKPIMAALEARERVVAENIAEAKRLNEEATEKLKGYEAQIASAKDEVREIIERGRHEAEAQSAKIVADAEATAARERERSLAEIEAAKNQALGELAQKSVDTAVGLAGQIVRKSLSPEDHAQLIQDAVDRFPSQN